MSDGNRWRDSITDWNRGGRLYVIAGGVSAVLVWFSSIVISLFFGTSAVLFAYQLYREGRTRVGGAIGIVGGLGLLAWLPLLLVG